MGKVEIKRPLALGDSGGVAIVPLSEPVPRWQKADFDRTQSYFRRKGYTVSAREVVGSHRALVVGDKQKRVDLLTAALEDPRVKVIFMANGGNAADALLEHLPYSRIVASRKHFVGYSDATSFQLAILNEGLSTWHGPNGGVLCLAPRSTKDNLWNALRGRENKITVPFSGEHILREGLGEGITIGGNLANICRLLGTEYNPFPKLGRSPFVLFWEEYEETFDDIAAWLRQLRRSLVKDGVMEKCRGMVVGKLRGCSGAYEDLPTNKALGKETLKIFGDLDFPIIWGVEGLGHVREKVTIPQGAMGILDTASVSWTIDNHLKRR